jgi:ABC-type glycerol-3-phosphate transport system substrate-binding protein
MFRRSVALVLVLLCVALAGCTKTAVSPQATSGDQVFATAFEEHQSGIQVTGEGTVTRILSDDTEGERHQRFIIALASGQTLLIAHNIDVAPRVASLAVGDSIEFKGVYEWNDEGGVVHWTHHDPDGQHVAGWIKHDGIVYQ